MSSFEYRTASSINLHFQVLIRRLIYSHWEQMICFQCDPAWNTINNYFFRI